VTEPTQSVRIEDRHIAAVRALAAKERRTITQQLSILIERGYEATTGEPLPQ
jgi:hypothetical protein